MHVFSFLKKIFPFLFYLGISVLCLTLSYQSFSGSHLDAQFTASPYLKYSFLLFLCIVPLCICIFTKFRLPLLLFLGIALASFGESFYRAVFHFLFICFLLIDFISPFPSRQTEGNGVKAISLLGISLFLIYLSGFTTFVWYDFDYYIFKDLLTSNASIKEIARESGLLPMQEIAYFIEFLVLAKFSHILISRYSLQDWKNSFSYTLAPIVFITPIFLFFQIYKTHSVFYINQNSFWDFSGRFSALFSDPNAFGIMSAIIFLLIPCIYEKKSIIIQSVLLLTIFASSLWSGSRTFFLILILYILLKLYEKIFSNFRSFSWYIVLGGVFVSLLFVISVLYVDSPSINRLRDTFNPSKIESMVESRFLFSNLAIASIKESPIRGIGLGRFYHTQDTIAERNEISLGEWRDNANNFYLQIAVEFGIPALMFLIFLLYRIRKMGGKGSLPTNVRMILFIFLFSLLTGPHLFFLEVRFLIFLLLTFLASCDRDKGTTLGHISLRPLLLLCVFFFVSSVWWSYQSKISGLYGMEIEAETSFRWSGRMVNIPVCTNESFFLEVKNPLFPLVNKEKDKSQTIIYGILQREYPIYSWNEFSISNDTDWYQIPVPSNTKNVKLLIRDVIAPRKIELSDDPRVLGVQLKDPIESCPR